MEPLSQALLGASVGYVASGRALGRRALGWGALCGMLPDLDVFIGGSQDGFGEMLYHRGSTHALWFGPLIGPVLGALLWRLFGRDTPLRAWQKLAALALVTHPLLDVFTPYGTQLFAPFWRARFAFHGIGIVDPFYTTPLLVGVLVALLAAPGRGARVPDAPDASTANAAHVGDAIADDARRSSASNTAPVAASADDAREGIAPADAARHSSASNISPVAAPASDAPASDALADDARRAVWPRALKSRAARQTLARRACLGALAFGALYLCAGVALTAWTRADAARVLAANAPAGAPAPRVKVYPTLLQPLLHRVTATDARGRFSGWHTAWKPGCLHGAHFEERDDPRLRALRATPRGQLFVWYALGDVTGRVEERADGSARALLEDLRYAGLSDPPQHGMWGVHADFDASGKMVGRVTRFYRREVSRGDLGEAWRILWRMVRGDFGATPGRTLGDATRCG